MVSTNLQMFSNYCNLKTFFAPILNIMKNIHRTNITLIFPQNYLESINNLLTFAKLSL